MAEDLEQFRARLNGAAISTYILVMLVVPLKLWCRTAVSGWKGLGLDDYLCVLALACANVFFYICMCGMWPYLARHALEDVPLPQVIDFLRFLFAGQLFYVISLAMIKYTILAFYWRLFSLRARIPIFIGLFIVTAWAISIIFLVIFTCSPISAQWDLTITDSKCISLGVVYISGSTPNVITDWLILLAPIPYVARLHAPLAQRLVLAGMFMLGCFVAIVSIIRLTILVGIPLSSSDVTYNTKEVIVWSTVEINIGLVSACLPSMKPALHLLGIDRFVPGVAGSPNHNQQQQQQQQTPGAGVGPFPPTIGAAPSERSKGPGGKKSKSSLGIGRSRSRKTVGVGLFSSLTGLTKLDDDEYEDDSFQMIGQAHARHGKTEINVESSGRRGGDQTSDEESESGRGQKHLQVDGGISVQKDWRVMRDEKRRSQRASQCIG
ncbi:hypothetical protein PFICI_02443 [Pestalotiopsis fici W106-1]|uniref:Rhodopsin domain-containing protein n=1 Tax=Pestalotiopsis fici (strain W106-1 / CGMCC3.15140) TaxID=1229662 RepID=W3XE92_PESFW|nr:uncharacterized protein PFICI_02443 [Pestalotiopsis fici W106-1]ETS84418.1 hypothetical protein PFICI_02443 [Pestalotiopsis fici W106-1]